MGQSWASVRSKILKAVLESQYIPEASHCFICKEGKGCIRCHQCGPKNLLCFSCDEEYHKLNPLHDRDIFHEGFFQPVAPTVSLDSNGDLITTSMLIVRYLINFNFVLYQFFALSNNNIFIYSGHPCNHNISQTNPSTLWNLIYLTSDNDITIIMVTFNSEGYYAVVVEWLCRSN